MTRAPFATTVALIVVLAVGGFGVVMPLVMSAIDPVVLPPPFPPQHQTAETLSYLLAFVVILPLAVLAGRRLSERVCDRATLPALSGLLVAALGAAVIAVKLSGRLGGGDGVTAVLVAALAWWLVAAALLVRAARPWRALADRAATACALAAAALLGALLCFADLGSISLVGLFLGALGAAAAVTAHGRFRLPRRAGVALDVALLALVLAVVPDLVIFRPEEAAGNTAIALETGIIQFHHDFLLGPANEVLGGRAMLVGTASQYGVSSIYLLAAWFQLAPIGYGTLGLLTGALTALWFGAGYAILRLAGTARLLTAGALGLAVVALVLNLTYPVGALPQSGPLRFGLPMVVILAAVAAERYPGSARAARAVALAAVALSAIWALEAFAYTAVAFAAVAAARAWLAPAGRLRRLARDLLAAALAGVAAHAAFAAVTLAASGSLPDWGEYLAYLDAFLFGSVGDLTYDVSRWTPALPVGAAYLASAAALAELARRRPAALERERPALVALAGMTAYGIALLSYYVDRSQDHILTYVALPALLTGALWLGLLLRAGSGAARNAGLAFGLAVATLLLAVAWSAVGDRLPRSALAHAAPGGRSLSGALDRLWDPPPLAPAAPAGEAMLARHMPGERTSLVMASPDLGLEILLRSGRHDKLSLGDPWEASFVAEEELPELGASVDALRPGDRMLMDQPAREMLAQLRARPSLDPLADPSALLAPLQQWALQRIERRFRLRPVGPPAGGFTVVELAQGG